jgi:hypothetical protein
LNYTSSGLGPWVDKTYSDVERQIDKGAGFARLSTDGEWLESSVPLPVSTFNYADQQDRFELVRRRFVIDGWVQATITADDAQQPTPWLTLRAPLTSVWLELDRRTVRPEILAGETIAQAITRFTTAGAVYYPTIWDQAAVPVHQIRSVIRRHPYAPDAE